MQNKMVKYHQKQQLTYFIKGGMFQNDNNDYKLNKASV